MRDKLLKALASIDAASLSASQQLTLVRTIQIALNRFGWPSDQIVEQLTASLDPMFPAKTAELNWLLSETLAYLQAPGTAEKTMELIAAAPAQEEQMQYARSSGSSKRPTIAVGPALRNLSSSSATTRSLR
jgi:hypothetical protein